MAKETNLPDAMVHRDHRSEMVVAEKAIEPLPIGTPPGLGNPDPRDYVPYKAPADRPVRRSGTPN